MLILFALAMLILFGAVAIAVDGSYGFVQNRRAQNAADFSSVAGAKLLAGSQECNGTTPVSNAQMVNLIQDIVSLNNPDSAATWTAQYLDSSGRPIPGATLNALGGAGSPPPGACGLSVNSNPTWHSFVAGVIGQNQMNGTAGASAGSPQVGTAVAIVSLNKVGPHVVLGGGTGTFTVSGNINLNTNVKNQPWTGCQDGYAYDDAIDAKNGSNLYVYGTVRYVDNINGSGYNCGGTPQPLFPLDTCFPGAATQYNSPGNVSWVAGAPPPYPTNKPPCNHGNTTVAYNQMDHTFTPINDPLQGGGAPPNLWTTKSVAACPGMGLQSYSSIPVGTTVLKPGEYTVPVKITGSMTFGDCSTYAGEGAYPGFYLFDQGLWITPQAAGSSVTGSNVLIATQQPYPVAGNEPGSLVNGNFVPTTSGGVPVGGNGAPCLPAGTTASANSGGQQEVNSSVASSKCGGTSNYGVITYGDSSFTPTSDYGKGDNFSAIVGGATNTTVSLSGPTTGGYAGTNGSPGLVFYQDPATQANFGFDALSGDAAAVSVTGVIYNASLSNYGANAPLEYWDGTGGGIPLYAGGTLQTGYGAGWTSGPAQSAGSVTVTGTTIVDQFNTDGATTITIVGRPYALPGTGATSLLS
ncbi:MAG TPA: pilus assembly protein TadG-related protein [Candidatus Dormibacteraeota bacterium]|nr:pilus assembly protein TadG-related protein [Candidatus Dormibacteraeota bacterium]